MTTTSDPGVSRLDDLLTWQEASTSREAIDAAVEWAEGAEGATRAAELLAGAEHVVVTGAGSSYYLALVVASVIRSTMRRPALAVPLSELILRPATAVLDRPSRQPVIVISRSGSTSEAVAVAEAMRAAGHPTIATTCRPASPLAGRADVTLVSPAGDERAIVMTRSFASMLALLLRVVAAAAGDTGLATDLGRATAGWRDVEAAAETASRLGQTAWSRIVVLGGGAAFGIASEWGLKLLETSQVPISVYEPLEFRHGPISVCEPGVLVAGLVGGPGSNEEVRVVEEAGRLGATTWLLAADGTEAAVSGDGASGGVDEVSGIGRGLSAIARLPLLLLPGQALAVSLALTRGCDPDAPRHLDQVVILDPA